MRRWFLSYNSRDLDLVERLESALRRKDSEAKIFFAPSSLRAGGYWLPQLADAIADRRFSFCWSASAAWGPGKSMSTTRRVTGAYLSFCFCLKGNPRPACRSCDICIGSSRLILHPKTDVARLMDASAGDGAPPGELLALRRALSRPCGDDRGRQRLLLWADGQDA